MVLVTPGVVEALEIVGAGRHQSRSPSRSRSAAATAGATAASQTHARAQEDAGRWLREDDETFGAGRREVEPPVVSASSARTESNACVAAGRSPAALQRSNTPRRLRSMASPGPATVRSGQPSLSRSAIAMAAPPLADATPCPLVRSMNRPGAAFEDEDAALVEHHQVGVAVAIDVARAERARGADRNLGSARSPTASSGPASALRRRSIVHRRPRSRGRGHPPGRSRTRPPACRPAWRPNAALSSRKPPLPSPRHSTSPPPAPIRSRAPRCRDRARASVSAAGGAATWWPSPAVPAEADLERGTRPCDQARRVDRLVAVEIGEDEAQSPPTCSLPPTIVATRSSNGTGRPNVWRGGSSAKRATGTPWTLVVSSFEAALKHRRHLDQVLATIAGRFAASRSLASSASSADSTAVCACGSACHASSRMRRYAPVARVRSPLAIDACPTRSRT